MRQLRSNAAFDALKLRLVGCTALTLTEADVERLISDDGREVLRCLLQGHIDLRSATEPRISVVGEDGIARPHMREGTSRPVKSVFGEVTVARKVYTARNSDGRVPLDADLNLPPKKYSLELRRMVALTASRSSYDETVAALGYSKGLALGKRQVEEQARAAAVDFNAFYAETELVVSADETGDVLVITTDGKGVVMLTESLRPATRKAARTAKHKLATRLSGGEKKQRKRMATVAAVYTVKPFVRCAHDVMAGLRLVRDATAPPRRPRPEHKRVWASLEQEAAEVIEEAFAEALFRDPRLEKRWVVCVDGAEHQLKLVQQAADRLGVEVTIVIDLIHVIEYLWKAAHVLNKKSTARTERWVQKQLARVLAGEAGRVAGDLRRSATMRKLKPSRRKQVDKAANYLSKNKERLRYDLYLAAGLPIATGVIEGACRHLICDRMGITGARWSLAGAEAVLQLRALRSSGDFDQYWKFHEEAEAQRNHGARYAGGHAPCLRSSQTGSHLRLVAA